MTILQNANIRKPNTIKNIIVDRILEGGEAIHKKRYKYTTFIMSYKIVRSYSLKVKHYKIKAFIYYVVMKVISRKNNYKYM